MDRYKRTKELSYLLLKSDKDGENERLLLYDNYIIPIFIVIFFSIDLVKHFYFFATPLPFDLRVLYGDIIVSKTPDQRLFNLVMVVTYLHSLLYFYFYFFDYQRLYFYKLSQFLIVLDIDKYTKRFHVTKQFAKQFFTVLDIRVRLNNPTAYTYCILTYSFYLTSIYHSLKLGFSFKKVLSYSCPSILIGYLAFGFYYFMAVSSFTFFILYLKMLNAKVDRLTRELFKLDQKVIKNRMSSHISQVNSILKEFKISKKYFERSLLLLVPALLITLTLFPSIIIISKQYFTHRLIPLFSLNLTQILIPIVKSNETFKRKVSIF